MGPKVVSINCYLINSRNEKYCCELMNIHHRDGLKCFGMLIRLFLACLTLAWDLFLQTMTFLNTTTNSFDFPWLASAWWTLAGWLSFSVFFLSIFLQSYSIASFSTIHTTHLHNEVHETPDWKHSQYLSKHFERLQLHPTLFTFDFFSKDTELHHRLIPCKIRSIQFGSKCLRIGFDRLANHAQSHLFIFLFNSKDHPYLVPHRENSSHTLVFWQFMQWQYFGLQYFPSEKHIQYNFKQRDCLHKQPLFPFT